MEHPNTSYDHNPWESFPEGFSVEKDFATFPASANFSTLSSVSFIAPNVDHDMHNGTVAQGDTWLQANLNSYAQWAKANNSLLMVVWDELGDTSPNNQVAAILYGANVIPGTYNTAYNHYNTLSTILAAFNLTGPNNAATAATINVFGRTISTAVGGPVVLGAADGIVSITSTGTITATSGADGIDGSAAVSSTITNNGKIISPGGYGISLAASGTVINSPTGGVPATIYGAVAGLMMLQGGTVSNSAGASISAVNTAIYVRPGGSGTVVNAGGIGATGSGSAAIDLAGGGGVTNNAGGSISGTVFGVFVAGGAGTVTNTGLVSGSHAIALQAGGSVTNTAGGVISGGVAGFPRTMWSP